MIDITASEIDELFKRHGIVPVASDHEGINSSGGIVTNIYIARGSEGPYMTVMINDITVIEPCPLDEAHARSLVERFRTHGMPAHDTRVEHMFANLLLKLSKLFTECEAVTVRCDLVHMHPTAYHIGKAHITLGAPLSQKDRLAKHSHDSKAVFAHRHGDSTEFPR